VDLEFKSHPVRGNGLAHPLNLRGSNVCNVGVDEILFGEGFMEQVLDCCVQVALVVGSNDFFGELGEQEGWEVVKCQV
jgi:hypothetical protein